MDLSESGAVLIDRWTAERRKMNIQGNVSAWRPSNTNYTMAQPKNRTEKGDAFSSILSTKSAAQTKIEADDKKMIVSYQGVSLEEWAKSDPKYTDSETGISWYIRDGKHPYMLDEDAEKFNQLCQESGEFPLKKFGEMTGLIQQLDENTVSYVGTNGTVIKNKDGNELFVDTSHLTYDMIMELFNSLPETDDYFDSNYWNIQMKAYNENTGEVSEKFANMSFEDILNSAYGRNVIPTVNQIVSSRNANDREIYVTYFTDDRITCNYGDGRKAWEIEIKNEQELQKVNEFFDNYTPNQNWVNTKYYLGNDMGMAVQKSFWLDWFNN